MSDCKCGTWLDTIEAMLRAAIPNGAAMTMDELEAEVNAHSTKPSEYIAYLRSQLAAEERECEELRTHLVATANQVQDNCWCAPGDKCPAHAAREYLQESTHEPTN